MEKNYIMNLYLYNLPISAFTTIIPHISNITETHNQLFIFLHPIFILFQYLKKTFLKNQITLREKKGKSFIKSSNTQNTKEHILFR